ATELAAEMPRAEARHGILRTEGRARAGALAAAARHDIEVIDGRRLWTLLRPYVGPETRTQVEAAAEARSRTEAFCVAGLALALGALGVVSGDALVDGLATLRAPRGNVEPQALAVHERSEEHTSELQSREKLVCRLLLEKKKQQPKGRSG